MTTSFRWHGAFSTGEADHNDCCLNYRCKIADNIVKYTKYFKCEVNMKKVSVILLSIFTLLFFISCGSKPAAEEEAPEAPEVTESVED